MSTPTISDLQHHVSQGLAIRSVARLQPAGGSGDKILPPTYAGMQYATERRRIGGVTVECVLVDSVQSQANRMELALLEARDAGRAPLPLISVAFPHELVPGGRVTTYEAPHRIADAIFRDSLLEGTAFRNSPVGQAYIHAEPRNATGLLEVCPHALLFGCWDSTGELGGSGNKFQRAITSEVIGVGIEQGVRTASRVDPLGIERLVGVYKAPGHDWTLDPEAAEKGKKGEPIPARPSELNHGNVTPDIIKVRQTGEVVHGGVTCDYLQQTAVVSLAALRRLQFPDGEGKASSERNIAARTALAALGLAAIALQRDAGFALRSRCDLVPESLPYIYEVVSAGDTPESFSLTSEGSLDLLRSSVEAAKAAGLPWREDEIALEPQEKLLELVRRTRAGEGRGEEEAA